MTSGRMRWEVTLFSTGMAGPRGCVCSLPHGGWDSIHLRIQLCPAQLFHPVMSEHSVGLYSSEDSCPGGKGEHFPPRAS